MKTLFRALTLLLCLTWAAAASAEVEEIKVYRVGSSSFPYELIEQTRAIVEASGDYKLICDPKADQAGYTRLDRFRSQPGLFEEWCEEQIPKIEAGDYDYVIFQTIGWLNSRPEDQDRLCEEILPELTRKVEATGAQVVLYDKYIPVQLDQDDPAARAWCLRYPEGYRLNYLLHISAARRSGIEKISFGGEAVSELRTQPPFDDLDPFYADGHPGPLANYLSAVNLAFVLTGEDPVGSPVRDLPLGDGRARAFRRLQNSDRPDDRARYESNKDRVLEDRFILRDEEAKLLQTAAMESHRRWNAVLQENLTDDAAFAETQREIDRIQAEMNQFEKHGLDPSTVASLKRKFAPPANPGELKPAKLAKIRRKSRSIDYSDHTVRGYCSRWLTRDEKREVQQEYERYWSERNSKLRDDIYLQSRIENEKALRDGRREDAERYARASMMIRNALSFPAYRILMEQVTEEERQEVLKNYQVTGPKKRSSPQFAAYQNERHLDREKLLAAWEVYLTIWDDPDLMDKLRDDDYSLEAFLEADQRFVDRMAERAP